MPSGSLPRFRVPLQQQRSRDKFFKRLSRNIRHSRYLQPRPLLVIITFSICLIYLVFFAGRDHHGTALIYGYLPADPSTDFSRRGNVKYPPTWGRMDKFQKDLPQHDLDLPFPEGRTGRYVKFSNQIRQLGWNNCLNEMLMNNVLAYETNRSYVFNDYWWKKEYYHWPKSVRRTKIPRTPLNAIISGPTSGAPYGPNDPTPRSVHEDYYELACPKSERRIINTGSIKPAINEAEGSLIFETWKKVLLDAPERCIEVVPEDRKIDGYPQTFDLWFFGSIHSLSTWDRFKTSPVSTLLRTSPIVLAAVERNIHLFRPVTSAPSRALTTAEDPFRRVVAMHVRRGDYKEACNGLAQWNSSYYNWNLLPELPDQFVRPMGGGYGWNTPENYDIFRAHCLPDIEDIVKKARDSKKEFIDSHFTKDTELLSSSLGTNSTTTTTEPRRRALDVMYLLTNDRSSWMKELIRALRKDGWETIRTSGDLELDQLGLDVNMAVDMDIAGRAAVFVGNGWSSMSSNIVHRRIMAGHDPIGTRFW